ncbi:DUF3551 domain-containing protein [Bradyrhizobium sp. 31Argb]|uniref:DUF3551 domain-containing protein n=1 Tax=unclassified Bradyrhizobium TaxID=2631580 RepID=UPI00102E7399|nr:DUF3551 domain-containing protein [Bradyrhizobium sp. Leo170]TAI66605.1 hypothetical protein CWO89_07410 [Bradyrhizobium sp. Leo170]
MRIPMLAILTLGAVAAASSARAQIYDPNYPVCLHVYGPVTYYECSYTSLPQCAMSASGRAAQCVVNPYAANAYPYPYAANAYVDSSPRRHKRYRRAY